MIGVLLVTGASLVAGGLVGLMLWLVFAAVGWETVSAAFVAGVAGMFLANLGLGIMIESGDRQAAGRR